MPVLQQLFWIEMCDWLLEMQIIGIAKCNYYVIEIYKIILVFKNLN